MQRKTIDRMTVQDEVLTLRESAQLTGLAVHTLRTWVQSGKLPAARYRNTYVISKTVLNMAVEANKRGAAQKDDIEPVGMEALLTETQVAKILGVTRQRVNQLLATGKLPCISFGPKVVRISKADVERFVDQRAGGATRYQPQPIDLLTTDEVAEQLRCSRDTVKSLIKKGELKAAKVGGSYRIEASSVRGYLRRQTGETVKRAKAKPVRLTTCGTCANPYPLGGFANHLNDAEHVRALFLRKNR